MSTRASMLVLVRNFYWNAKYTVAQKSTKFNHSDLAPAASSQWFNPAALYWHMSLFRATAMLSHIRSPDHRFDWQSVGMLLGGIGRHTCLQATLFRKHKSRWDHSCFCWTNCFRWTEWNKTRSGEYDIQAQFFGNGANENA